MMELRTSITDKVRFVQFPADICLNLAGVLDTKWSVFVLHPTDIYEAHKETIYVLHVSMISTRAPGYLTEHFYTDGTLNTLDRQAGKNHT